MNICIAFTPMPAGQNPNIMSENDSRTTKTYYEMIFVSFSSLRRYNREANLCLITTESPPSTYLQQLNEIGVNVGIVPFDHRPPEGYTKRFLGSFYLLDAIMAQPKLDCLYLDPDIICLKPLDEVFAQISNITAYSYEHGPSHVINGLSCADSVTITNELFNKGGTARQEYTFYGGGFHYIPESRRSELVLMIDQLYEHSLNRFRKGFSYYTTEEHVLSAAYSRYPINQANEVIKVVWTAPSYRRVSGTEMEFPLLHFPAEKEFAFKHSYRWLTRAMKDQKIITNTQFERYVFKKFQLGRKSWTRFFGRIFYRTISSLKKSIHKN